MCSSDLYGFIASHFMDYIWEIKKTEAKKIKRHEVVEDIDKMLFDYDGKRFKLGLLRFICSVNNSVKHVHLNNAEHNQNICDYHGIINLNSLQEKSGKVWFVTDVNEFDYGRIVLRPVAVTFSEEVDDKENVALSIYSGDWESGGDCEDNPYDPNDSSTAIDSLIWQCTPPCIDCGFDESECECSTYKFSDDITAFCPESRTIDFDKIMGEIGRASCRERV